MNPSESQQSSAALQFVLSQGWTWKEEDAANIRLDQCPYCNAECIGHGPFKLEIHGTQDELSNRDGLHLCHRCGRSGTLYALKQHLGVTQPAPSTASRKDWERGSEAKQERLPDIDACHQALLEDEAAMDYLRNGRGFSREVIVRQRIGLVAKRYFRETGEVRAIVYPYLVNGNCVYVHYRTLPDMDNPGKVPKAFSSPTGWDAQLYNGEVLHTPGLTDIIMVEGEANCIAALDHGIENICGVPGANVRKAEWIEALDKLKLERIYVCYDKDKAGQKAAQALASRIGVEHCWKITLPDFSVTTDAGITRPGKDLNEWFTSGGTAEAFAALKADAQLFDVDGVASSTDATQELLEELHGRGIEPRYKAPWPSLNKLVGFDQGDVIDILAPEKIGKTTFGMNLLEHVVDKYGEDGILICLEMTRARLARKWVAHLAQIADNIPKTPEEATALLDAFTTAIPKVQAATNNRTGHLYFCSPQYKTTEDIYALIRDCIRRYGVRWVMIDNLHLLCDTTLTDLRNRTPHLSKISKMLVKIAKEYNVQMIRILQPHRIGDGKMVNTDNVDGSSQIAKDCDCMITLHRNRVGTLDARSFESMQYVEQEASFDEKMLVTVGLSRYSSGGYVTLQYDGARSSIKELSLAAIAKLNADANADVGYERQLLSLGVATAPAAPAVSAPPVYEPADAIGEISI